MQQLTTKPATDNRRARSEATKHALMRAAEKLEEGAGEDGLLAEVIEGEGDKQKITAKALKARLKEIGRDPDLADERQALEAYQKGMTALDATKKKRKAADGIRSEVNLRRPST